MAFMTVIASIVFYVIRYQWVRLSGQPANLHLFNNMIFGLTGFVMFLFAGYLSYMNSRIISRAEQEVLENLAYKDAMTGLCNRARGERIMHELDSVKEHTLFAIVNFDLNGLKRTNDSLGHFAGDAMIKKFAEILDVCFSPIGTAIRMSGDEFIVIVEGVENINRIDDALNQLEQLEREASDQANYVLDASYGVARSMEFLRPEAELVYQTADRRMYDMKEVSKKGRE
jgi:diguanylate cyclase (GGDEF)-like protein